MTGHRVDVDEVLERHPLEPCNGSSCTASVRRVFTLAGKRMPLDADPVPDAPVVIHVVTGGFPCQDVSLAGARAGLRPDTRSGLWSQMAYAVSILRPNLMIAENVRGLLSGSAHSDVEPCPWCLGDTDVEPPVRAFGAVLADLADIGYDAQWLGLRASDVGAPHARFRVFVAAAPAYADGERHGDNQSRRHAPEVTTDPRDRSTATDSDDIGSDRPGHVTDVPGLTRNDMLRALGNGVVPQQAAHALRVLLSAGRAS